MDNIFDKIELLKNKTNLSNLEKECLDIMLKKAYSGINTKSVYTESKKVNIPIDDIDGIGKYKIYCLLENSIPVYVGITKSIDIRIKRGYNFKFDFCKVIEVTDDAKREAYWIEEYSKMYNIHNKIGGIKNYTKY